MTSVATAVATFQLTGYGMLFLDRWMISWSTILPVVILVRPS